MIFLVIAFPVGDDAHIVPKTKFPSFRACASRCGTLPAVFPPSELTSVCRTTTYKNKSLWDA